MITISPATLRRLRKIKQSPVIWEGARCSVPVTPRRQRFANVIPILTEREDEPEYILWADATSGIIRSMAIVEPGTGSEAMVRSLIQAIEYPQTNLPPMRPHKIVVNDRQSQFYLRGILQELDITVEFAEKLPLIEEILYTLTEQTDNTPDPVPLDLAPQLYQKANTLWNLAPWKYLNDCHVIEVKLDRWDINSFFITFMGNMGLEFGLIFYHSLESIKLFRMSALEEEHEGMSDAFLNQNCIFMVFNRADELGETMKQMIGSLGWQCKTHYPCFGILHPLEGDRGFLHEEETLALIAALDGLSSFFSTHSKKFRPGKFPDISVTYTIDDMAEQPSIVVRTLAGVSNELQAMTEGDDDTLIDTDWLPENTVMRFTYLPREGLKIMQEFASHKVLSTPPMELKSERQPIFLLQNSKPVITALIKSLTEEEEITGICFVPAKDYDGDSCQLGLLVTGNGNLHLFEEFYPQWALNNLMNEWKEECKNNGNKCVIVLAMGSRGKTKGNPKPSHILGYYEVDFISFRDMGLGMLTSFPNE